MTRPSTTTLIAALSVLIVGAGLTAQSHDRFTVISPNGISFGEFKGYDAWQVISASLPGDGIKVVVGNPLMIKTYAGGFPANGQAVPEGAVMAKLIWSVKDNPSLPGGAKVTDTLKRVQFMVKDAKRFPDTDGWGYADFAYDTPSGTFTGVGNGAAFAKAACHQCHIRAKARDYVFSAFALR
jgi:hypothetical protein